LGRFVRWGPVPWSPRAPHRFLTRSLVPEGSGLGHSPRGIWGLAPFAGSRNVARLVVEGFLLWWGLVPGGGVSVC